MEAGSWLGCPPRPCSDSGSQIQTDRQEAKVLEMHCRSHFQERCRSLPMGWASFELHGSRSWSKLV
jgi:hypothetical protein